MDVICGEGRNLCGGSDINGLLDTGNVDAYEVVGMVVSFVSTDPYLHLQMSSSESFLIFQSEVHVRHRILRPLRRLGSSPEGADRRYRIYPPYPSTGGKLYTLH